MGTTVERQKNRRHQRDFQKQVVKKPGRALKERMESFLSLYAVTLNASEAAGEVGVKRMTVEQWRTRFPEFNHSYNRIRAKATGEFVPERRPFDAAFRQEFFHFSTPKHLQTIADVLNEMEAEARSAGERRFVMILAPPEFAKTTVVEDWVSHGIATEPNSRTIYISKTLQAARKRVGRIQRRMTDRAIYPEFVDTYGPFKSEGRTDAKPWTKDYFTVFAQTSGERDHTLEGLGIGGQIYGSRAERIVLDDIADLSNQTPGEIEKQLEWIWVEVRSRLVKGGLLVVIGTHMREQDVYTRLEEKGMFHRIIKMPAIVTDGEEERSLWPEQHPLDQLKKLRESDLRLFELVYQQNPLPQVGAVFPLDAIESCYDPSRRIGHVPDNCRVVAGIDPSVRNFTAAVAVAVAPSGYRYLVDVWNEKGLTGEGGDIAMGLTEFIVEFCKKYRVRTLALESNSTFALLSANLNLRRMLNDLGVTVMTPAIGPASGEREELALAQLSGLFTNNLISIPAQASAPQHFRAFVHQLSTWQPGQSQRKPQDMVKALRMAEMAARREGQRQVKVDQPGTSGFLRRKMAGSYA